MTTSRENGATNSTSSGVATAAESSPGAQETAFQFGNGSALPAGVEEDDALVRSTGSSSRPLHDDDVRRLRVSASGMVAARAEPRGGYYALSEATSSSRGWSNSALKAATTSGSNWVPAQRSSSAIARSWERRPR